MEKLIDKAQALLEALEEEFLSENTARRMDELLDLAFDLLEGDEGALPLPQKASEPAPEPPSRPVPQARPEAKDYTVYSDGACEGNPGPGGWGCIVEHQGVQEEYSGGKKLTTNNVMEMRGAIEGLKQTPDGAEVEVVTDSQYLVKGITQWIQGWKKRGWKKADGKPVLNQELWQELDQLAAIRQIRWTWVKGHAGHPENERCDELARQAVPRR